MIYVRVCRIDQLTDALRAHYQSWLDEQETRRLNKTVLATARDRFLLGRALIRSELSAQAGISEASVVLQSTQHGRPLCAQPLVRGDFNISHSGQHVVLARVEHGRVGIDIEHLQRQRSFAALAKRYFHPDEVAQLSGLGTTMLSDWFYRHWTLKEAFIKANDTVLKESLLRQAAFNTRAAHGIEIMSLPDGVAKGNFVFLQFMLHNDVLCALARQGHDATTELLDVQQGLPGQTWQTIPVSVSSSV